MNLADKWKWPHGLNIRDLLDLKHFEDRCPKIFLSMNFEFFTKVKDEKEMIAQFEEVMVKYFPSEVTNSPYTVADHGSEAPADVGTKRQK
jgi:hypothetical protein